MPGLTDNPQNIQGLAKFVSGLGNVEKVEILPFHKMGEDKYVRSGITYNLSNTPAPTADQIQSARNIFALHGVEAI